MKLLLLFTLLVGISVATYTERQCGCSPDKLWLDVVLAIDVSSGMTSDGVTQVVADIVSVFISANISQAVGQTTRIGVVTYASKAVTAYKLTYFNSSDQFLNEIWSVIPSSTTDPNSNLKKGLEAAESVLQSGRRSGNRDNVKQAIVVYASDYESAGSNNPVPTADRLKTDGVAIMTVAFNQGGEASIIAGLKNLASPGMFFPSSNPTLVQLIQNSMCQVNCFCPNSWIQYYGNGTNYGVCVKFGDIDAVWLAAKLSCQHLHEGAYLASEFSQDKHNFNQALSKKDQTSQSPYTFFIGLSYNSAMKQFAWEQPAGKPVLPLNGSSYQNGWNSGYPTASAHQPNQGCVLNMQHGINYHLGWEDESCVSVSKRYLCQVNTCDTDNYCTSFN